MHQLLTIGRAQQGVSLHCLHGRMGEVGTRCRTSAAGGAAAPRAIALSRGVLQRRGTLSGRALLCLNLRHRLGACLCADAFDARLLDALQGCSSAMWRRIRFDRVCIMQAALAGRQEIRAGTAACQCMQCSHSRQSTPLTSRQPLDRHSRTSLPSIVAGLTSIVAGRQEHGAASCGLGCDGGVGADELYHVDHLLLRDGQPGVAAGNLVDRARHARLDLGEAHHPLGGVPELAGGAERVCRMVAAGGPGRSRHRWGYVGIPAT